jgi:hypothetical protein
VAVQVRTTVFSSSISARKPITGSGTASISRNVKDILLSVSEMFVTGFPVPVNPSQEKDCGTERSVKLVFPEVPGKGAPAVFICP